MKITTAVLASLALAFALVLNTSAQEKKKEAKKEAKATTLKGEIGCLKCGFDVAKTCSNGIKVKEGDKETIYAFEDEGAKTPYHKEICQETKKGAVTGVVVKKGDKATIKPSKDGVKFE